MDEIFEHKEIELKMHKTYPWQYGRLALSQQACRFELPMDTRIMQNMTPSEYLKKYCILSSKRDTIYQKIFSNHQDYKTNTLSVKDLERAVAEVLTGTMTGDDFKYICDLAELAENSRIDYKLFAGVAALSERLLYPKFVTGSTENMSAHDKDRIERADFCGFEWNVQGVSVHPGLRQMIDALIAL